MVLPSILRLYGQLKQAYQGVRHRYDRAYMVTALMALLIVDVQERTARRIFTALGLRRSWAELRERWWERRLTTFLLSV